VAPSRVKRASIPLLVNFSRIRCRPTQYGQCGRRRCTGGGGVQRQEATETPESRPIRKIPSAAAPPPVLTPLVRVCAALDLAPPDGLEPGTLGLTSLLESRESLSERWRYLRTSHNVLSPESTGYPAAREVTDCPGCVAVGAAQRQFYPLPLDAAHGIDTSSNRHPHHGPFAPLGLRQRVGEPRRRHERHAAFVVLGACPRPQRLHDPQPAGPDGLGSGRRTTNSLP
jgi:hypothetical protein